MASGPRIEHVMGMPVRADVRDAGVDPGALDAVFAWLRFVDATFSTYDPASEISRLRRGELAPAAAHPLVRAVLERCEELGAETRGGFDVGAPPDPTGLVKGWAVERAAAILEDAGARNFCLDAGGDVCLRGVPAPGRRWRVGIRHPRRRDRLAAVLEPRAGAVATSGAYERGPHIVDPRSGRPATGVLSVTVVGPDLGTADAYATAAFALGSDGPAWTATLAGYAAMTIVPGDRVPDATFRGHGAAQADGDRVLATPSFLAHCAGPSVAESLCAPRCAASPSAGLRAPQ